MTESSATFACFGSTCSVRVLGAGSEQAVAEAQHALLGWHDRFTRFSTKSELSKLNASPHERVRVSTVMALFAEAVVVAARYTAGLVDGTLLGAIERAGYRPDLQAALPLDLALRLAPARRPAGPDRSARWRDVEVDRRNHVVTRPPGLSLDSGGLAKGLLADVLGRHLARYDSFAVDCAGDLLLGGTAGIARRIEVASPFGGAPLHAFELKAGSVATSGIGRRSWLDPDGRPAHHLLDPATGRPAFTGIVQVTALAATGLEAEIRSKAALLSGPAGAARWLPDGGVVVHDDGHHDIIYPPGERNSDVQDRAAAAA